MKAGGGKIINFGSGYSLRSAAGNALYSASKAGVWNLTRTMALDWAGDNIQLNLIAPGWISTEMTDPVWEDTERTAYIIDETPAGRLGEPEDLAGTGIFLASAASDFITGNYIRPAGGAGVGDKTRRGLALAHDPHHDAARSAAAGRWAAATKPPNGKRGAGGR